MIREGLKFLAAVVKSFRRVLWKIRKDDSRHINMKVVAGDSIKLYRTGDIARIMYEDQHLVRFGKSFEYKVIELMVENLKEGDTVIDVGANIGLFSIIASKHVGHKGKVHAFEPTSHTFEILQRNIELNQTKNISAYKIPLADKVMPVIMINPSVDNTYGDALNRIRETQGDDNNEAALMTSTLDIFVREHSISKIDFIKIDIEGAELLFLNGAGETLRQLHPKMILEANEKHTRVFGYKVIDVLIKLHSLGYDITQINEEQWFAR